MKGENHLPMFRYNILLLCPFPCYPQNKDVSSSYALVNVAYYLKAVMSAGNDKVIQQVGEDHLDLDLDLDSIYILQCLQCITA